MQRNWRAAELQRVFACAGGVDSAAQGKDAPRASFELSSELHHADPRAQHRMTSCGVVSSASAGGSSSSEHLGEGSKADASGERQPRHHHRRSLQVQNNGRTSLEQEAWLAWQAQHPCVLTRMAELRSKLEGKRVAVFLDYDGTLTPIVANPDEAFLSQQMREAVRDIALLFPTAIISGRGREKVESFVQLKELYYAGSHGMDIAGPTAPSQDAPSLDTSFQPAAHFRPVIDDVYAQLCDRLKEIPGSSVEHNTFCVSAHFRNCATERWHEVVAAVEEVVADHEVLRITRGRKVLEVRPKVDWNKGTALEHLLGMLGLKGAQDVVTLYVGDDQTDEDAFRVLKESSQGFGILVTSKMKDTSAFYTVRDPGEVHTLLQALVGWGRTDRNGWAQPGMRQQEKAVQQHHHQQQQQRHQQDKQSAQQHQHQHHQQQQQQQQQQRSSLHGQGQQGLHAPPLWHLQGVTQPLAGGMSNLSLGSSQAKAANGQPQQRQPKKPTATWCSNGSSNNGSSSSSRPQKAHEQPAEGGDPGLWAANDPG